MSNNVNVSFSNNGQATHYVVENTNLADSFDVNGSSILGSTYISDDVTDGDFDENPYTIPASVYASGGDVLAEYLASSEFFESYSFVAEGWNNVKNISVTAEGTSSIFFIADNFVHADMDFSGVVNDVFLQVFDGKRGNYITGEGNDFIQITSSTNNSGWSNLHQIDTGSGNDTVLIAAGDDALIDTTIVNYTDGRFTTVKADLGEGNDVFSAGGEGIMTADYVDGGTGNDNIFTGAGDDVIDAGEDDGILFQSETDALIYEMIAFGDTLGGGDGADEFLYSTGDGFDYVIGFSAEDILTLDVAETDVVTTEIINLQNGSSLTEGILVSVNGDGGVFLENYVDTTDVFV